MSAVLEITHNKPDNSERPIKRAKIERSLLAGAGRIEQVVREKEVFKCNRCHRTFTQEIDLKCHFFCRKIIGRKLVEKGFVDKGFDFLHTVYQMVFGKYPSEAEIDAQKRRDIARRFREELE